MYKKFGLVLILLTLSFVSASCSAWEAIRGCPDGINEWVDSLMLNDISYTGELEGTTGKGLLEKGNKIGEVKYMMADRACSDHKLKNGDAAFLPIGTEVYESVGYKPEFRVIADGRVFQVRENKAADTIGELYDIQGKVAKIGIESWEDGTYLGALDSEQVNSFMEEYLSLSYEGDGKIEANSMNGIFLLIHLEDGSFFRILYWTEENIISPGIYGTVNMKRIVEEAIEN